jgi:hypothetical protein
MEGNNRVSYVLYRGSVNKQLRLMFGYKYEPNGDYPTIKMIESGTRIIDSKFSISISEGFEKDRIFIPGGSYWLFVALFHKSLTLIQSCLNELYTNMSEDEFEVNSKALEIFIQEKSLRVNGMSIVPTKWVTDTGKCYVALHVTGEHGEATIPLQDAIGMDALFTSFDPITFGLVMLGMFMS